VLPSTGTDFSSATHKLELTNTSGATKVIVHYLTYTVPGEDPVTLLQTGIAPPGMPYSGTFLFPSSQTPYVGAVIKSRTSGFSTELEALP
jgi:hypothetical protein